MLLSDEEMLRHERGYLLTGQRGRPLDWHYREIRAGLERRLDADPVLKERNRKRVRFNIRVLRAKGVGAMRLPVRFLPAGLRVR